MRTVLVAVGGHALIPGGGSATSELERERAAETCRAIAAAAAGCRLVVTHGNGPQVGAALRRGELTGGQVYPLPLDLCVASTQGEIGVLLQQGLQEALAVSGTIAPVVVVVSQVVVARHDRAFLYPSKQIGPPGSRRLVPSPEPLEIVEEPAIRALVDAGIIVIALGGGGVPVVRRGGRLEGVRAVVDKDLASAVLAIRLGVDLMVILTDVDGVYVDFATPRARRLREVTADDLRRHAEAGHFPPGTMGPKVEAALRFVTQTAGEAIVTSPERLTAALAGHAGTHVVHHAMESRSSWPLAG